VLAGGQAVPEAAEQAAEQVALAAACLSPSCGGGRSGRGHRVRRSARRTPRCSRAALSRLFLARRWVTDRVLPEARVMGAATA
jgi:hypothetical protein